MSYKLVSVNYKRQSDKIKSYSVGYNLEWPLLEYEFNQEGPVYGPNEQWELDPDNDLCDSYYGRPVFATCKNNCPGGELCYQLSVLSYFAYIKL